MKIKYLFVLALFLISADFTNLNAQVVTKIPPDTQLNPQDTSEVKVMVPIGEVQDTAYLLGVRIQEREPLKVERFMVVTRRYIFENPKYNKTVEQWVELIKSALNPTQAHRINNFEQSVLWYKQIGKPK